MKKHGEVTAPKSPASNGVQRTTGTSFQRGEEVTKVVLSTGRRKAALARATVKDGGGKVFINGKALEVYEPELARSKIFEPLILAPELAKRVDIEVSVKGGGYMGQAEAVRTAIARGLVKWSGDPKMREIFKQYDWTLVKSDVRFKEPKKPGGPGARARFQKSYR